MKSRAAICHTAGEPLTVEEIQVEGPREGEVLVEVKATGICHTDAIALAGMNAHCVLPAVLGHEGAGVVVEAGSGVSSLGRGDHVIPLYGAECGTCAVCRNNRTNLCWTNRETRDHGVMPDGTVRFLLDGRPVHHFMGTSTFSNYTVVPEIALAKIRKDAPLDKACLLGCGVTTGVGAALHDVRPDDTVAVFGLGGIGVNIVQGARLAGAKRIIGIDTNPGKRTLAERFGMTDFINPKELGRDLVACLIDMTDGGVDISFECTGDLTAMQQGFECCHVGWGTCVLLGVEPEGSRIGIRPGMVRYGRSLKGSYFGGVKGRSELGRYVDLYMDGKINIDDLITHVMPLDNINHAFHLMHTGESIRSVILH